MFETCLHIAEIRSKNSGIGHVISTGERVLGVGVYTVQESTYF